MIEPDTSQRSQITVLIVLWRKEKGETLQGFNAVADDMNQEHHISMQSLANQ